MSRVRSHRIVARDPRGSHGRNDSLTADSLIAFVQIHLGVVTMSHRYLHLSNGIFTEWAIWPSFRQSPLARH